MSPARLLVIADADRLRPHEWHNLREVARVADQACVILPGLLGSPARRERWDDPASTAYHLQEALAEADAVLILHSNSSLSEQGAIRPMISAYARQRPVISEYKGDDPVAPITNSHLVVSETSFTGLGSEAKHREIATLNHLDQLRRRTGAASVALCNQRLGTYYLAAGVSPAILPSTPLRRTRGEVALRRFAVLLAVVAASGMTMLTAHELASATAGGGFSAAASRPCSVVAAETKAKGGLVVATGGCFDILHAGHVATLQASRRLGQCLLVFINSDDSVRRLKGQGRPVVSAGDRARVLASLDCVDAVSTFDEDEPARLIRQIRPDIWVKGGDYAGQVLPEQSVMDPWGGQAVVLPRLPDRSSSAIVEAAQDVAQ